ncbi:hypothetical protein [Chelativorans sp.]|uniref:hypothetical protein n=1 Tax=Chelativorans sp. TaxID=2203393 RepID=UPI002810A252|nr:hypothetical protein [Chelativorans sp.]
MEFCVAAERAQKGHRKEECECAVPSGFNGLNIDGRRGFDVQAGVLLVKPQDDDCAAVSAFCKAGESLAVVILNRRDRASAAQLQEG